MDVNAQAASQTTHVGMDQSIPTSESKTVAMVIYCCYLSSYVLGGIPAIVGLVLAYVQAGMSNSALLKAHYSYQIRTFWYGVPLMVLGFLTWALVIGILFFIAWFIWTLYRNIKGMARLNNGLMPA